MKRKSKWTHLFAYSQKYKIVPQGLILGPLLLNVNTLNMLFEQKDVNFAAYADDNKPYNHELKNV